MELLRVQSITLSKQGSGGRDLSHSISFNSTYVTNYDQTKQIYCTLRTVTSTLEGASIIIGLKIFIE